MNEFKPVSISRGGFAFCRFTVAALVWLALLLRQKWLLLVVCGLMTASWAVKIRRAPLIWLYRITFDRLRKPEMVMVDEKGMRFAHAAGAVMSGLAWLLWTFVSVPAGLVFTLFVAVMKTSAAFGKCSALKLYTCMKGGNCCRLGRYLNSRRHV